jgi:hypothetical protein
MFDQKICLLFASTAMQSEVHVELDRVYARQPVGKLTGTVEEPPASVLSDSGGIINITFAPLPTASRWRSFLKFSGDILRYAAVIASLNLTPGVRQTVKTQFAVR